MDMDLNKIMSLLKGHGIVTPPTQSAQSTQPIQPTQPIETQELPQPTTFTTNNQPLATTIAADLDLSKIDPSVIAQVRNEYLAKKNTEDKLKNAISITPEVLVAIGNMVKETDLIQVLKKCKERQDKKEKELFSHRESIKERYKKRKEAVQAKELIGVKIDPNELRTLDRELNAELRQLDLQIIKDMDKEVTYLQQEFVKLNVPLFKVSNNPNDIKLQQRVLTMLQDMI